MRGTEDWMAMLTRFNLAVLNSNRLKPHLTPEVLSTGWCGLPPATPQDIEGAERRLGIALPPSYRAFLSVANGWLFLDDFIERLLPVHQVDWLRSADPDTLGAIQSAYQESDISDEDYTDYETARNIEALRHRYYPECLLIGRPWGGGGEMILLNSKIVLPNGEWEAIFFADWIPGNQRYRSFYALMMDQPVSL